MKTASAVKEHVELPRETNEIAFPKHRALVSFRTVGSACAAAALIFAVDAQCLADPGTVVATPPNPYAQGNFTVAATQALTAPPGIGGSLPAYNADVNINVEPIANNLFNSSGQAYQPNTIGVSYTDPHNGNLTAFGVGSYTYDPGGGLPKVNYSTGLELNYSAPATNVTVTLTDFDLNNNATGFNTGKVAPNITVFGTNGLSLGTLNPTQVFAAMTPTPIYNNNNQLQNNSDVWNVNVNTLLADLGKTGTPISNILLSSDLSLKPGGNGTDLQYNGNDPYFLIGSTASLVPEPNSALLFLLGSSGVALLIGRRRRAELISAMMGKLSPAAS